MARQQTMVQLTDDLLSLLDAEVAGLLTQVLAVPATRTVRDLPTEVALDASDGMPFCTSRITTLGAERMDAVCRALLVAAQC